MSDDEEVEKSDWKMSDDEEEVSSESDVERNLDGEGMEDVDEEWHQLERGTKIQVCPTVQLVLLLQFISYPPSPPMYFRKAEFLLSQKYFLSEGREVNIKIFI